MSLNWDITEIENNDDLKVEAGTDEHGEQLYTLHHRTEALIFACISVGIGHITEDNAAEFYARLRIVEGTRGAMCYGPDPVPEIAEKVAEAINPANPEDYAAEIEKALREAGVGGMKERDEPFTIAQIKRHVGLRTNVSFETREEWARRMIVGQGDHLTSFGEKLMSDEQLAQHEEQQLKRADELYDAGRYSEAQKITDNIERFDVSMTRELIHAYNTFKDTDKADMA